MHQDLRDAGVAPCGKVDGGSDPENQSRTTPFIEMLDAHEMQGHHDKLKTEETLLGRDGQNRQVLSFLRLLERKKIIQQRKGPLG